MFTVSFPNFRIVTLGFFTHQKLVTTVTSIPTGRPYVLLGALLSPDGLRRELNYRVQRTTLEATTTNFGVEM
jgi:hypothetical protein